MVSIKTPLVFLLVFCLSCQKESRSSLNLNDGPTYLLNFKRIDHNTLDTLKHSFTIHCLEDKNDSLPFKYTGSYIGDNETLSVDVYVGDTAKRNYKVGQDAVIRYYLQSEIIFESVTCNQGELSFSPYRNQGEFSAQFTETVGPATRNRYSVMGTLTEN